MKKFASLLVCYPTICSHKEHSHDVHVYYTATNIIHTRMYSHFENKTMFTAFPTRTHTMYIRHSDNTTSNENENKSQETNNERDPTPPLELCIRTKWELLSMTTNNNYIYMYNNILSSIPVVYCDISFHRLTGGRQLQWTGTTQNRYCSNFTVTVVFATKTGLSALLRILLD